MRSSISDMIEELKRNGIDVDVEVIDGKAKPNNPDVDFEVLRGYLAKFDEIHLFERGEPLRQKPGWPRYNLQPNQLALYVGPPDEPQHDNCGMLEDGLIMALHPDNREPIVVSVCLRFFERYPPELLVKKGT